MPKSAYTVREYQEAKGNIEYWWKRSLRAEQVIEGIINAYDKGETIHVSAHIDQLREVLATRTTRTKGKDGAPAAKSGVEQATA